MLTATMTQDDREVIISVIRRNMRISQIAFPECVGNAYDIVDNALIQNARTGKWGRIPQSLRAIIYSEFAY